LAVIAVALPPAGGFLLLGTLGQVGPWLASHQAAGVGLYVLGFAVLAGLALLPTYAQAVLGGFAFGMTLGLPTALLGFFGAAMLAYAIARRATGEEVLQTIDEHPKLSLLRKALLGRGWLKTLWVITLIRLPPNSPFALTNVALASLRVPRSAYALGTLLGMAPRTAVAVYLGAGLSQLTFENLASGVWFYVGIVVTIAVVIVLGVMSQRALRAMSN
jgi:uncharacterized membrane protein YdjX (TVP38/TMEM64 family)